VPKQKTRKCAAKRLHVTGGGRVTHHCMYQNHLLSKKSRRRKRSLAVPGEITGNVANKVKGQIIPYA
jgi:large subunit ribosomal protein L35